MHVKRRGLIYCLLLFLASAIAGCREPSAEEIARPVRAVKVGDVAEIDSRSFPGQARATEEVNLSFQVSGPLIEFPVGVGDEVSKDQLLAKIDPRDFSTALETALGDLARAEANLDAMKQGARPEELEQLKAAVQKWQAEYDRALADFQRNESLLKTNAVSRAEFDRSRQVAVRGQAELRTAEEALRVGEVGAREEDIRAKEAEIRSLKAAVQFAEDQLNYTFLKAPFDGVVAATYAENFENVQAKQQVLRLLNVSKIEFTVQIPEHLMTKVEYLQDLVCVFDAFPETPIEGVQVKEIGREASEVTRTYPVTLIMDQPDPSTMVHILPGMAGRVQGKAVLPDQVEEAGFVIPETALFAGEGDQMYVWVIDEEVGSVRRQAVIPGQLSTVGMRVTGLEPGWWIATAGVHYLNDGQKVRIQQPAKEETK